ncbi:MAG: oxidoreductase [Paracoccus sp. (in: a-proteobacteria)]
MTRAVCLVFSARVFAVVFALFLPTTSFAGSVLLMVQSGDRTVSYDAAALAELGPVEVTTSTIWTEGLQHFTGVPLEAVLADAGITEGTIVATAINDYSIEIPIDETSLDEDGHGPTIAFLLNGKPMSVRDKGPLWLIYPYDSKPEFQTEVVYFRSIWQLSRISQAQ